MYITKIRGKYYDITNFKHPGGKVALSHSFNRDATILLKSYHPFTSDEKFESILKKYEIEKLPENYSLYDGEEDVPKFDFNTDFTNEMKSEVKKYFEKESKKKNISLYASIKATNFRWIEMIFLTILKIVSNILWIKGNWSSLILLPLFDWLTVGPYFHEAAHFSFSSYPVVNKFMSYFYGVCLINTQYWYNQHNIAHHTFTNIPGSDNDLYVPLTRYHPIFKNTKYLPIIQVFVLSSLYWYNKIYILYNYFFIDNNDKFKNVFLIQNKYLYILDSLLYILYYFILPLFIFNFTKALIFIFIPRIIISFFFMLNSQITHIHTDSLTIEKDWYKHQVLTSTNHGTDKLFNYYFSAALNYQIEHHLFPGVNHCHFSKIQPIVKKICKKYNVKYKEFNGYYDAFLSYYNHLNLMYKLD